MGTTYSMPHTPEDFLANMDDNMEEFPDVILDDVQSLIDPPTTKPDNVLIWL